MMTQYIITDPSYLLSEDEWEDMIHRLKLNGNLKNLLPEAKSFLEEVLNDKVILDENGYGDWDNVISDYTLTVPFNKFSAETGMFCICKYTNEVIRRLKWNFGEKPKWFKEELIASFLASDWEDLDVTIDKTNPYWFIIRILDKKSGAYLETAKQDPEYFD